MADDLIPPFADDDFRRMLCVVAHPDDVEYGVSSAVAAWTASGVQVAYLLLTRGEAGMDSSPPERTAELRTAEQIAASRAAGVTQVEFLDHPDGVLEYSVALRRDIARVIRRHKPDAVVAARWAIETRMGLEPGRSPGRLASHARCPTRRRQPLGLPGAARRGPAAVVGALAAGERRSAAHAWCGRHRRTARTWHCFPGGARPVPGRAPRPPPAPG